MWGEEEERKQTGKLKQWLGQTNEKGKGTNEKWGRDMKKKSYYLQIGIHEQKKEKNCSKEKEEQKCKRTMKWKIKGSEVL